MNNPEDQKYILTNSGDHHLAQAKYDPSTGKISVGAIVGFSNNASASLQIIDGKTQGTIIHSGDTHNIKLDVNNDGTFSGTFEDKKSNIKIEMQAGVANLVAGRVPVDGINIKVDHHAISLKMNENNQLCGVIESKDTQNSSFKLNIDQGKVSGSISHIGDGHETNVEVSSDGKWRASLSAGLSNSKWSISVENGNAGIRIFSGLKFGF